MFFEFHIFWMFDVIFILYLIYLPGDEVFYIDCTNIPLEHLELIVREVYLPLMCTNQSVMSTTGGDKVMDVLHRLMSAVEITQGHVEVIPYQCDNHIVSQIYKRYILDNHILLAQLFSGGAFGNGILCRRLDLQ